MISSPSPLRGLRKRNQRTLVVATVAVEEDTESNPVFPI
jgi:hypothetical protein